MLIMLLRLAPLVGSPVITFLHVGRIILLILLHVLLPATILVILDNLRDIRTEIVSTSQHQNRG